MTCFGLEFLDEFLISYDTSTVLFIFTKVSFFCALVYWTPLWNAVIFLMNWNRNVIYASISYGINFWYNWLQCNWPVIYYRTGISLLVSFSSIVKTVIDALVICCQWCLFRVFAIMFVTWYLELYCWTYKLDMSFRVI